MTQYCNISRAGDEGFIVQRVSELLPAVSESQSQRARLLWRDAICADAQ